MKKLIVTALLLTAATPAFAQAGPAPAPYDEEVAPEIGGLRIEAHVGMEKPNLNEEDANFTYAIPLSSSFAYGGEIGYDIPVSDAATVGPYVSYDLSSSEECDRERDSIGGAVYDIDICTKSKSNLSVGVRGALVMGRGEIYLGLGYDMYDLDYTEDYTPVTTGANLDFASTDARGGIGVSLGYNHQLNNTLYLGLGMKVSEFGNFEGTDWNLQRFQGHVNIGARF